MRDGGGGRERVRGVIGADVAGSWGGVLEMGFGKGRRLRTAAAVADALDGLALRHCGDADWGCMRYCVVLLLLLLFLCLLCDCR